MVQNGKASQQLYGLGSEFRGPYIQPNSTPYRTSEILEALRIRKGGGQEGYYQEGPYTLTTTMELSPRRPSVLSFWGPNITMVVHVDAIG